MESRGHGVVLFFMAAAVMSAPSCSTHHTATHARVTPMVVTPSPEAAEDDEAVHASPLPMVVAPGADGMLLTGGRVTFAFSRDPAYRSTCYRECASAWSPVTAQGGKPQASRSLGSQSVGSIQRADGVFQVTYDGRPLYYPQSKADGTRLQHSFGGVWSPVRITAEKPGG